MSYSRRSVLDSIVNLSDLGLFVLGLVTESKVTACVMCTFLLLISLSEISLSDHTSLETSISSGRRL